MHKQYAIKITENLMKTVYVSATSEYEALEITVQNWNSGVNGFDLNGDDFSGVEFDILSGESPESGGVSC
jgi:hypothetical protein